ncbi:uncharacterized protein LOC124432285 [Vespa crabro]|uniref:uncharacterized protein LOC124432285 n=1 Tax=Vespa crabro TaxID=7445 RepID=UPI001F02D5EE|nr:uncharacterized protein LOC124432285 [Vespa crabro]
MKKDRESVRRLKGDGLSVEMDSNNRILEVTGDGCKITLTKNCGSVRVVGDGCRVKVTHNVGDIVYTGDGGRVLLGPKSSKEKVQYFGEGGKISFDSDKKKMNMEGSKGTRDVKESIILKNYLGTDKDKNIEKKDLRKAKEENLDLQNEKKETFNRNKIKDNNQKEMKNIKSTTVFMSQTNHESKDYFEVNKWFVSPASIAYKYVENVPTVTIRGEKKTTAHPNK